MRGHRAAITVLACLAGLTCCTDTSGLTGGGATDAAIDGVPGSPDDAGSDGPSVDAAADSTSQAEAGRALTALAITSACASRAPTTMLALSDVPFTVTFWVLLRNAPSAGILRPLVGAGGRSSVDPGWTVGFDGPSLVACAGDSGVRACTTAETIKPGHRLHVALVSDLVVGQAAARTIDLYVLDADAGETTHRLARSASGAANNWAATASFAVGGAATPSCAATVDAVVDEIRIWNQIQSVQTLDLDHRRTVPCGAANLLASYRFDEGTGAAATDCVSGLDLTVAGSFNWMVSPFP